MSRVRCNISVAVIFDYMCKHNNDPIVEYILDFVKISNNIIDDWLRRNYIFYSIIYQLANVKIRTAFADPSKGFSLVTCVTFRSCKRSLTQCWGGVATLPTFLHFVYDINYQVSTPLTNFGRVTNLRKQHKADESTNREK